MQSSFSASSLLAIGVRDVTRSCALALIVFALGCGAKNSGSSSGNTGGNASGGESGGGAAGVEGGADSGACVGTFTRVTASFFATANDAGTISFDHGSAACANGLEVANFSAAGDTIALKITWPPNAPIIRCAITPGAELDYSPGDGSEYRALMNVAGDCSIGIDPGSTSGVQGTFSGELVDASGASLSVLSGVFDLEP